MELRHLRYFVAVAEELHFTRAAERLHLGQPPLSQQIQALEAELGVALFMRTRRKVSLTVAGERFLLRAREILAAAAEAADEARRAARGEMGELRVGFTASLSMTSFFPALIYDYRLHYPQVALTLREMFSEDQCQALIGGKLDVGFVRRADAEAPEGWRCARFAVIHCGWPSIGATLWRVRGSCRCLSWGTRGLSVIRKKPGPG
jgi:DNA-binding transcriptional LysR family regulator